MAVKELSEMIRQSYGHDAEAYSADPSQPTIYQFRYKVLDLADLIASHDDNLTPNPNYPHELQPRLRDRVASQTQVENIARNLNPKALLHDTGFIDTGPMIIGSDNVVESGNGRVLALRMARKEYPERYRLYKTILANTADKYGISEHDVDAMSAPVLVRERITAVDRAQFARDANVGAVMGMSPFEQAMNDSKKLSPNIVSQLQVGEEQTIDQALRMKGNEHIVAHFVSLVPQNERATIADAKGQVNLQGMNRLKLALFTKTYTGESGQRLARIFSESADPQIKAMENAMFQSLPDMAKAESLVDSGKRESNLSVAPDLAEVIDTYAGIKTSGITVKDYLAQNAMFEDRLNLTQKAMLGHLDGIGRKPKLMREFLRDTAQRIIDAPIKGQVSMMGIEPVTKENLIYGVINQQRAELGEAPIMPATASTRYKELEKSNEAGTSRAEEMAREVGSRNRTDTERNQSQALAPSTSVQVGLAGMGKESAQVKMLEEFGTAPGAGGKKDTLVDVEAIKARETAKPLPSQIDSMTGKTVEGETIPPTQGGQAESRGPHEAERVGSTPTPAKSARRKVRLVKPLPARPIRMTAKKQGATQIPTVSLTKLREIEAARSKQARAMDAARLHSRVLDINSPRVPTWITDPGRADISGIDTPPISKRASLGRSRGIRITPRSPRIGR